MPNSPLLDKKMLGEFRRQLEEEKNNLEGELSRIAEKDPDVKGDWKARYANIGDDWDENAQEVADFSTRLGLERTLETRLKKVNEALGRMDKNDYGYCAADGEPISLDRLRANPATTLCLDHTR